MVNLIVKFTAAMICIRIIVIKEWFERVIFKKKNGTCYKERGDSAVNTCHVLEIIQWKKSNKNYSNHPCVFQTIWKSFFGPAIGWLGLTAITGRSKRLGSICRKHVAAGKHDSLKKFNLFLSFSHFRFVQGVSSSGDWFCTLPADGLSISKDEKKQEY